MKAVSHIFLFFFLFSFLSANDLPTYRMVDLGLFDTDKNGDSLELEPAGKDDLKIIQLHLMLNHKTKGVVRRVTYTILSENDSLGSSISRQYVKCVDCYKDSIQSKVVVCELVLNDLNLIRKNISIIKGIYQAILSQAKSIISSSFEQADLRVIMKAEEVAEAKYVSSEGFEELHRAIEKIDIDQLYVNSLLTNPKEKILVVWEDGIPYYQDAFFEL